MVILLPEVKIRKARWVFPWVKFQGEVSIPGKTGC